MVVGGSRFKASLGKRLARSYLKNKPGMVVHIYNPSYEGGRAGGSEANQGKSAIPYLKNNLKAKGLRT
jgi:hypothetical protein